MPLFDITNDQLLQPTDGVHWGATITTVLSMDAGTPPTLPFDFEYPLEPMDPRTFPSSDFSSLDEDYPAVDTIRAVDDDFRWCFGSAGSLDAENLGATPQVALPISPDDGDEDEDEDVRKEGVPLVVNTPHWQHASLNHDGPGTTWAQRNSDHPVLPTQMKRGNASKETRKLQAIQAQKRQRELISATDNAKREIDAILQRVADQYDKKIDVIKQMAFDQTRHRYRRDVSLHDAKISWKMKQEKDKLLPGQTPKMLAEIQALVREDVEMANWSKDTQEKMMQRVHEIHAIKAQGARVSNHAAAMDYQKTIDWIEEELTNLAPRTGAMSIALFTRAHVDDVYVPDIFASSGAERFIWDVLHMDPLDLVRKFEQWACSRASTLEERNTMSNLHKEITSKILSGLRFITKKPGTSMSYSRYQTDIIEKYSVELIGWPARLAPMKSPSEFRVLADLKLLRNALVEGSCRWVHLSRPEVLQRVDEHQKRTESGNEATGQKRKTRSDKGKKRGPNKRSKTST
ncbi:uncharacterized protein ARMOST_12877 [Armillaria ostoyae]|uniref:Uncharacterized protein n=1 Tax=Armillaria ostoyae TaxID=47428 RepID=A0A284RL75_ARMOS|nr:uncharacterized protein ARMOST_12877 [Armillaria ostoyae]